MQLVEHEQDMGLPGGVINSEYLLSPQVFRQSNSSTQQVRQARESQILNSNKKRGWTVEQLNGWMVNAVIVMGEGPSANWTGIVMMTMLVVVEAPEVVA